MEKNIIRLYWGSLFAYLAAWGAHLYTATVSLRGFFGDASLAFLVYLSDSTLFNKAGHWVHLFNVASPRDFQLFLSAIALQVALALRIENPETLKYIFVFWQYVLPGLLYLTLFYFLWRAKKSAWIVFPLVSWAVLSVPVDWASINSTRWAVPLFWMHFFVVLFADKKIRALPLASALFLGLAMWGGLYESVVLHGALCIGLGIMLWRKNGNRTPLYYALAAVPGMLRTGLSYIAVNYASPNGFHEQMLAYIFVHPYFLFMALALCFVFALWFAPKIDANHFYIFLGLFLFCGGIVMETPSPNVWWQMETRFDYVILSLGLMAWAGGMKLYDFDPAPFARYATIVACLTGVFLWVMQSEQTGEWEQCYADYNAGKGDKSLIVGDHVAYLYASNDKTSSLPQENFGSCLWDWAAPWTDLLIRGEKGDQNDGDAATPNKITQWPILTFWQDFAFVEKDGEPYLRTNNWTLTSPSLLVSGMDLPLKTKLYDLTPLHDALGDGPLLHRTGCMDPAKSGSYWQKHLTALDDYKRHLMNVCPGGLGDLLRR